MALGFAATRLGWFDDAARRGLSRFVFTFAIPILLFRTLAGTELPSDPPWTYLLSYYGGVTAIFLLSMLIARIFFGQPLEGQAVVGMAGSFSNTVLLGAPLILTAFGEAATLPLFLLIALHGVTILPLGTILIETGLSARRRSDGSGPRIGEIARQAGMGVVTNPIILGLAAGLAANLAGWAPTAVRAGRGAGEVPAGRGGARGADPGRAEDNHPSADRLCARGLGVRHRCAVGRGSGGAGRHADRGQHLPLRPALRCRGARGGDRDPGRHGDLGGHRRRADCPAGAGMTGQEGGSAASALVSAAARSR
ncbi:MAG: hypothetical protein GVY28_00890 [Alphaproteobacteria bacterium]|nr:hypothetical protein [Alphaproteobacteria bacterium]